MYCHINETRTVVETTFYLTTSVCGTHLCIIIADDSFDDDAYEVWVSSVGHENITDDRKFVCFLYRDEVGTIDETSARFVERLLLDAPYVNSFRNAIRKEAEHILEDYLD